VVTMLSRYERRMEENYIWNDIFVRLNNLITKTEFVEYLKKEEDKYDNRKVSNMRHYVLSSQ